ncbi:MAG: hypothetical protein ABI741_02735 [Ferruginibacter sp.]
MRTILFISFMISAFFVNAQTDRKNVPVEIKTFKMPRFPIADFPKRSIPVSDIQVIQMVRDSIRLGYALKGMDNHVVMLVPEKPLTYFLQEGIYKMYLNDFKEGGVQILWVIKDLRIGEKTAFNEYAYTRFNADAYISKDLVVYKKVCSIDTVFVNESGVDVTAWHGEDIEDAFRLLLKRTLKNAPEVLEQNTAGMSFEKIKALNQQPGIPILHDNVYREGAYATFDEFLQNKPSVINFRLFILGKKKDIKFVKVSDDGRSDTVRVWGFCKEGEIYKCEDNLLIPIEKQGNGFIISNYVEMATRRNGNIAFGAMIGGLTWGLLGGVVATWAGSASSGKALLVRSIPYITKAKKQPEASCIDMNTGELSF